jgi:hypothetical protein
MQTERLRSKIGNYRKYARRLAVDIGGGFAEADALFDGGFVLRLDGRIVAIESFKRVEAEKISWVEEGTLAAVLEAR